MPGSNVLVPRRGVLGSLLTLLPRGISALGAGTAAVSQLRTYFRYKHPPPPHIPPPKNKAMKKVQKFSREEIMRALLCRFFRNEDGVWMRPLVRDKYKYVPVAPGYSKKLDLMVPIKGKRLRKFIQLTTDEEWKIAINKRP